MQDLEITWPGGEARFSVADSPIHLGRSSGAAVPLTEGSVSRKHLLLVWDGTSWTASDSSTHGTFDPTGLRLPGSWTLSGERTIRLGGVEGVPIEIRPTSAASRPATSSTAAPFDTSSPSPAREAAGLASAPPPSGDPRSASGGDRASLPSPRPVQQTPAVGGSVLEGNNGQSAPAKPTLTPPPAPANDPAPALQVEDSGGSGGLFADANPNEPMLSFSEDSLFPNSAEPAISSAKPPSASPPILETSAGDTPSMNAPSLIEAPPVGSDTPAPSLLGSDTVSAFADPKPPQTAPGPTPLGQPTPDPTPMTRAQPPVDPPSISPPSPRFDSSPQAMPSPEPGPTKASTLKQAPPGPGLTGANPAFDPNSTLISDATLRISVGGQDYSFLPGADVTIGRDPSCLIQLDERHSLVSRKHLRATFVDDAWWLEDYSSKGTFIDGKRLKKAYKAEGAFVANLGDDDAGTPLRIITAGEHRAPRDKTALIIIGLAVAALVPLTVLALILTGNNSNTVEPDFATAKKSSVMLFGLEGGQGSGFFVSDDLILTNQHVSVLSPQLLVGVSREADQPAEIEYATELVANHPFLDLSVLRVSNRVTRTSEGTEISAEPVGDIDLPAATIGDSANVTIGDRVFNTGFPGRLSITSLDDAGELRLPSVVATSGEAANFAFWPGCSNTDADLYIPSDSPAGVGCSQSGDLDQGVLLSSFFSSGQGASGSAVYHNNEVVAVVYAGADGEDNANLGITTAIFSDWLDEIISQNP